MFMRVHVYVALFDVRHGAIDAHSHALVVVEAHHGGRQAECQGLD